jgi:hypothetical protein
MRYPQFRSLSDVSETDTHLTYMINIALTTEFALVVEAAR